MILHFHERALEAHAQGAHLEDIFDAPVRERIARAKYVPEDEMHVFDEIAAEIDTQLVGPGRAGGEAS